MCGRHSHCGSGGHAKEPRDPNVRSGVLSGGKSEEVGVDGQHAQAAHRSQCDAEEWNAVAGGGESDGLIFKTVARLAPRTDANVILQDVTPFVFYATPPVMQDQ